MTTNQELVEQVEAALRADKRLDPTQITVTADAGVVTLSGSVRSFAEREAAEEDTLALPVALDVANEIRLNSMAPMAVNDATLAHAVRTAIEAHVRCPADHIKSCVSHGVVALHGDVTSWRDVVDAEDAVGLIIGVQDVIDNLVVEPRRTHQ